MNRVNLIPGQESELIRLSSLKIGSLKELSKKIKTPYSTMKKYSQERLLLPEGLFEDLLNLSGVKKRHLTFTYLEKHWGCSIGGKGGIVVINTKYKNKITSWRKKGGRNRWLKRG